MYTVEAYEKASEFVIAQQPTRKKARRMRRRFFGHSYDVDLDRQGRILLPPKLREHGDLQGPVVVIGSGECLELWNPERYRIEEKDMEEEAESMEEGP